MFGRYRRARERHAGARAEAYAAAREDAIASFGLGPELRLADIDRPAIEVWRRTWAGRVHASGAGGWDWPSLLDHQPRRAAVLPIAIWYGDDLCGLALGYASRHRAAGARHTVTLTYAERRPPPPDVPLRGLVIPLAISAARNYGLALGATWLRLRYPDRKLLGYYELLGFHVAWSGGSPVYCEQEI